MSHLTEEQLQKEIELREEAVRRIIETKAERDIQLKKIAHLRELQMSIHAKKSKSFYRETTSPDKIKTPEEEEREKQELLKLIDSVGKKNE